MALLASHLLAYGAGFLSQVLQKSSDGFSRLIQGVNVATLDWTTTAAFSDVPTENSPARLGGAFERYLEMSLPPGSRRTCSGEGPSSPLCSLALHSEVPGMEGLYVWEKHPRPIIMPYNSHMTWYAENQSEVKLISLMRGLLERSAPSGGGLVVDMGINDGYVAGLGAAYGFPVVAADGQPECVRRFLLAAAVNGWEGVRVFNRIGEQSTNS